MEPECSNSFLSLELASNGVAREIMEVLLLFEVEKMGSTTFFNFETTSTGLDNAVMEK